MNKNLFAVFALIVIGGLVYWFLVRGSDTATPGLACYETPRYVAIEKKLDSSVGSDILVKYKTSPEQRVRCTYTFKEGDFEIKNVSAEYFLAFTDNFLILDSGTAPEPRGLVAYDLRTRAQVFTDRYAQPVVVSGDTITYFSESEQVPTNATCPELASYIENGLGAALMSKVTVDLPSLTKTQSGEMRCIATQ